jgi:hypothetical protein
LVKDLRDAENDLIVLDKQKKTDRPGYAIGQMMHFWGEEPLQTDRDIEILANQLWKSKEQFEKELREEHDKRDYAMEKLKKKEKQKAKYLKEACLFRMQAIESAMI